MTKKGEDTVTVLVMPINVDASVFAEKFLQYHQHMDDVQANVLNFLIAAHIRQYVMTGERSELPDTVREQMIAQTKKLFKALSVEEFTAPRSEFTEEDRHDFPVTDYLEGSDLETYFLPENILKTRYQDEVAQDMARYSAVIIYDFKSN